MEAETAAAAARQRQEEAEEARAKTAAAEESDAAAKEQAVLNRKAEAAAAKAKAARETAIEAAEQAGLEPPHLEPLAADAMPRRGLARKADGTPTKKPQRNFTDPDSHLMQSGGFYLQGYNCQLAVDSDHQVIVAVGVSNQPPDVEHLEPMLQRIATSAGAMPDVMTLDAGYWSEENARVCVDQGIDAYIATGRLPHGQPPPPQRGPLPRDADAIAEGFCEAVDPHGPQAQKQDRISDLRPALAEGFSEGVGDRGTGERADQGGPGPAALSASGP
jgi:hypothetical protein